ncbi:DgyrCDS13645 [Dimorphilus gyrociliatus]|uniref:non-specific serine/threonine protein kinase n=1 Tax=Dimorphilus gyrociliatus TaxID=2664684 RepID=A0A7I8WB92_9ANNE|nr:DgyrCDS13645 [Dimorphilus gyrociliatus]
MGRTRRKRGKKAVDENKENGNGVKKRVVVHKCPSCMRTSQSVCNIINHLKHHEIKDKYSTDDQVLLPYILLTAGYELKGKLNIGTLSKVLEVAHNGKNYVVKSLKRGNPFEFEILNSCFTNYTIQILDVLLEGDDMYALFDSCDFNLRLMLNNWKLKVPFRKYIINEIFMAIKFLHDKEIVHGDITIDHILIKDGHVKLTGFKHSFYKTSSNFDIGTDGYKAPEILRKKRKHLDKKIDLWSIGVCVFNCTNLRHPFYDVDPFVKFNEEEKQLIRNLKISEEFGDDLAKQFKSLMQISPSKRAITYIV